MCVWRDGRTDGGGGSTSVRKEGRFRAHPQSSVGKQCYPVYKMYADKSSKHFEGYCALQAINLCIEPPPDNVWKKKKML